LSTTRWRRRDRASRSNGGVFAFALCVP